MVFFMETDDARKLAPKAQEALRIRAVRAVLAGKMQSEVAQVFGVTTRSVTRWVKTYRAKGFDGLKSGKRGRPKAGALLPWQAAQIAWTIKDKTPDQLHFSFHLWTRESVALLIENRFDILLSRWTVGRYLKRWGYTPQKPLKRAYERDPAAVKKWIEVEYPAIRKQAHAENALILWGDEMGVRSDHAVGRTYGKRGQKPVVPVSGKRFSCNMISAISNLGHLQFMVFEGSFEAGLFIKFLDRLIRANDRKIYLILDNLRVHHSRRVSRWMERHREQIQFFFLPAYSPELNPDERLNQDVKANADKNQRAKDSEQLKNNIRSYLRKRQCQPDIVQNYFDDPAVRYAA
jgi:transposase